MTYHRIKILSENTIVVGSSVTTWTHTRMKTHTPLLKIGMSQSIFHRYSLILKYHFLQKLLYQNDSKKNKQIKSWFLLIFPQYLLKQGLYRGERTTFGNPKCQVPKNYFKNNNVSMVKIKYQISTDVKVKIM